MSDRDDARRELAERKRDELRHAFRHGDRRACFPGDVDSLVIQRELRTTLEQAIGYRRLFREFGLGWDTPEHPPTLAAWNRATLQKLRKEYPAETAATLRAQVVPNYYPEWWKLVEAHGKRFGQYRARFLTGLRQGERRTLVKWYGECIPRGYVLPECR